MTELSQTQLEVAQEFVVTAIDLLKTDQGIDGETTIAAMGRMAGTFLFRSFDFPLEGVTPGQAVLSNEANDEGTRLLQILGGVLGHLELELDAARIGTPVPDKHTPLLGFLETQHTLEVPFTAIKDRQGLSYPAAAEAALIATALIIRQCAAVLDPTVAFGIAAYGLIEGCKTAPNPVTL